ncbi:MAG: hypothetical protein GQ527_00465 [Bacteroidales bacterium]|nr:hypothetical protein [Bacteroidales bacterium]
MKIRILIILSCFSLFSWGQELSKKELKLTNTIRVYVNDTSKKEALNRFVAYLAKHDFPTNELYIQNNAVISNTKPEPKTNKARLMNIERENKNLNKFSNSIVTNRVELKNIMWGHFSVYLEVYAVKDEYGIYLTITGYASTGSWGIDNSNRRMQKGGNDSKWTQKDLYKRVSKLITKYEGVNEVFYLHL